MEMTVKLGLPPPECSSNFHGHFMRKARAVKRYRNACGWAFLSMSKEVGWVQPDRVEIEVVYSCYQKCEGYKPRDIQNAIESLKPAIDSMADAGIISGDTKQRLQWGKFDLLTTMKEAVAVDGPAVFVRVRRVP